MSSGVGVVLGKTVGNLAKSVGISIRVGLTLAVVVSAVASVANVSSRVATVVPTVSDSSVAGHTSMTIVNTSDHTNVVGVAGGIGVVLGKAVSNLSEGVSLSIRVSVGGNDGQEDNGEGFHLSSH